MQEPFTISWSASAQRDLARLPEKVATAVVEFIYGGLVENPRRVGHELTLELAGVHSARRGDFRVFNRIRQNQQVVTIVSVDHRADVCRRREIRWGARKGGSRPSSPCSTRRYTRPGRRRSGTICRTTLEVRMAVTASEARKNLFPLIEQVNEDRTPVEITSRRGDAVLLSRDEFDALQETAHLLRSPRNARRLLESLDQAVNGQREEHELQS